MNAAHDVDAPPRTQPDVSAPGRTLIVFPGALGDFLLLAPAIAGLRATGVAVELSVTRALEDLARALFPVTFGPPADGAAMASLFTATLDPTLARWLQGAARVEAWFGAADTLARYAPSLRIGHVACHPVERGEAGPHATDAYAAALAVTPVAPPFPAKWVAAGAACHPAGTGSQTLVVHPGAGAFAKRWSATGFLRVAGEWRARGRDVVVLLGPAEIEEADRWRAAGYDLAAGLDLRGAAAVIARARRYVGNDSGVSHLAAVLRRTGAVLFGTTSAARWRPRGGSLVAVEFADIAEEVVAARVLGCLDRVRPPH